MHTQQPKKAIIFVVNAGWFFISHRLPLAMAAMEQGYEVSLISALDATMDQSTLQILAACGIRHYEVDFSRSGASPFELLRNLISLYRIYRSACPDVVHLVTLKPIILGGLAARLAGVNSVVMAVPGRGSVFTSRGLLAWARRRLALFLYRRAYVHGRNRVIVQNEDDRKYFISRRVFDERDLVLIRGSGVEMQRFQQTPEPGSPVRVLLASRMLRDKGVACFVEASRILKASGIDAVFLLAGSPDPGNPDSHTHEELEAWSASGAVEWLGHVQEMSDLISSCHIVCLPTAYGEGVPKVLIEAAASGRPIVTTDTAGCRDIVRHGVNGLLVPVRDVIALRMALSMLITDAGMRVRMGCEGRALAEREFDVEIVIAKTLAIYRELQ